MTKTTNYQLNQWAKSDRIMMEDFNADNQKLDAALAAKCEAVCGSYTGDGASTRTIHLGFQPKAIVLTSSDGIFNTTAAIYGGLAFNGSNALAVAITDNGFLVNNNVAKSNMKNTVYHYLVWY